MRGWIWVKGIMYHFELRVVLVIRKGSWSVRLVAMVSFVGWSFEGYYLYVVKSSLSS